ncbi:hypothetical protein X777_07485 [Ooceraea biroi]|uniref:Uncharacterized protein n=1 Tax=Ooceraea biroi TaxID=2015173 RepID=A0A026X318_OOCBI|nr:hypothetical protein X777_07485 [Ooceraea biroi]
MLHRACTSLPILHQIMIEMCDTLYSIMQTCDLFLILFLFVVTLIIILGDGSGRKGVKNGIEIARILIADSRIRLVH